MYRLKEGSPSKNNQRLRSFTKEALFSTYKRCLVYFLLSALSKGQTVHHGVKFKALLDITTTHYLQFLLLKNMIKKMKKKNSNKNMKYKKIANLSMFLYKH